MHYYFCRFSFNIFSFFKIFCGAFLFLFGWLFSFELFISQCFCGYLYEFFFGFLGRYLFRMKIYRLKHRCCCLLQENFGSLLSRELLSRYVIELIWGFNRTKSTVTVLLQELNEGWIVTSKPWLVGVRWRVCFWLKKL